MDDLTFGVVVRTTRIRLQKRQTDLAREAKVSQMTISRIERGHLGSVSIASLRDVCAKLEIRVEVQAKARGADLDRMLNARHGRLAESVLRALVAECPEWVVLPEVSFNVWGERGVVDILAWHPGRRALLLIELKTEIVDVGGMIGTLDRKRRLGADIVASRGWTPESISTWLILAGGRTNERRVAEHRTTLRAAYPDDGRAVRSWLGDPAHAIAAMSMWPTSGESASVASPVRRVRPRRAAAMAAPDGSASGSAAPATVAPRAAAVRPLHRVSRNGPL